MRSTHEFLKLILEGMNNLPLHTATVFLKRNFAVLFTAIPAFLAEKAASIGAKLNRQYAFEPVMTT
jgi:hypothetical protein